PGGMATRKGKRERTASRAAPRRCGWATRSGLPAYLAYHDREWGVPVHDDRVLFEFLLLEGAQAGLSWATILKKRAAYRRAFSALRPGQGAPLHPPRPAAPAHRP